MQRMVAILIVIIFIMSVIFWVNTRTASGSDAGCLACHAEEVEMAQSRLFVHAPYRDGACGACHVQERDSTKNETASGTPAAPLSAFEPSQIRALDVHWVQECYEPSRHMVLPVSDVEGHSMLVVEIWDQCREEHQYVMPILPLEQLTTIPPQGMAPLPLPKVTLRRDPIYPDALMVDCNASVPVRGKIYLQRAGAPVRVVETGSIYQTEIRVSISSLERNASYSLYLETVDTSDRQQRSPVYEFVPAQLAISAEVARSEGCTLETEMAMYRGSCAGGPCYLLAVEASQPITLSIGTLKSGAGAPAHQRGGKSTVSRRPDYHPDIADPRFTNHSACRTCHPDSFGPMSHPVDIVPPEGMNVSEELHMLPDGRISCMTCHEFHAGEDHYRLRFKSRQKLCNACHAHY